MTARDRLLDKLRASLADVSFVKLTLSRRRAEGELRNVYARIVELKSGPAFSLTLRFARRDETRNVPPAEAPSQIGSLLADVFEEAHLFTTGGDWKLRAGANGEGTLKASRPTFSAALSSAHDREKPRAFANAPFLVKLGVTAADGTARAGMADKLRQIERFVEILGHLCEGIEIRRACDLGSGKGYLTFAAYEFLRRKGPVEMLGVEMREDMASLTEHAARELGCDGLRFERGSIDTFECADADAIIALHACDTATDDAIALGIRAGAKLIVTAPCCHKEVRAQLSPPPLLAEVLRHGILAERQAELLTDGLRAMILDAGGYDTKVFEFISNEHTGKNVMIAATKRGTPQPEKLGPVRDLMAEFGITRLHLLDTLAGR